MSDNDYKIYPLNHVTLNGGTANVRFAHTTHRNGRSMTLVLLPDGTIATTYSYPMDVRDQQVSVQRAWCKLKGVKPNDLKKVVQAAQAANLAARRADDIAELEATADALGFKVVPNE